MARPLFGSWSRNDVDQELQRVWAAVATVPLGADDPAFARFLGDADDTHVLRTASGVFSTPLASISRRFLISTDKAHFPAGTNWAGFEFISPSAFRQRLSKSG